MREAVHVLSYMKRKNVTFFSNTCIHIRESERKIERCRVCVCERGVKEAVHVHTWRKGEFQRRVELHLLEVMHHLHGCQRHASLNKYCLYSHGHYTVFI